MSWEYEILAPLDAAAGDLVLDGSASEVDGLSLSHMEKPFQGCVQMGLVKNAFQEAQQCPTALRMVL